MQNTATFRTVTRGAVQLVVLAAVAVAGVSVGRWVIPDGGSTGATVVRYIETTAPVGGADIIERKLAQMDAQDAQHGIAVAGAVSVPFVPSGDSIIEGKLAQMDAFDGRAGPSVTTGDDSIIDRKFAQMDAEDAR
jgi:hypothetical protein